MKKTICVVLLALIALAAYAENFYLRVPVDQESAMMARLDVLKGDSPYTQHYALVIRPWMATETTVLLLIDERAQSVLTAEEWDARLISMPPEFKDPLRP